MVDDNFKAVITLKDDYQEIEKKMKQEIESRITNDQYYQLTTLFDLSQEQNKLDKEFAQKVKETIDKYKGLSSSIFQTQQDIITGRKKEFMLTKEEIADLDRYFNANNVSEQKAKNDRFASNEVLPITSYWFYAFINFDLVKPYIKDKDELILRSLHNIIVNIADELSFEIKFEFKENEYFQNQYLVKTFFLNSDYEPHRTEGSLIEWFEGKDVCRKTVKKNQKNRKTGAIRIITHEVEDESFFNFFNSINLEEVKLLGAKHEGQLLIQNKLLDRMNIDFDIARSIIDELQPYNLEYFLNVRRIRPHNKAQTDLQFLEELRDNDSSNSESSDSSDSEDYIYEQKKLSKKKADEKKNNKQKVDKSHSSMVFGEKRDDCEQY